MSPDIWHLCADGGTVDAPDALTASPQIPDRVGWTPASGQGEGKLCPRSATACDPVFRSTYFHSKRSSPSGNHGRNITIATKMLCLTTNFAKDPSFCPAVGGSTETPDRPLSQPIQLRLKIQFFLLGDPTTLGIIGWSQPVEWIRELHFACGSR